MDFTLHFEIWRLWDLNTPTELSIFTDFLDYLKEEENKEDQI